MNARQTNLAIQAEFDKARIGKDRRETVNRNIRALVGRGNRPVTVDSIPAVNAPGPETYSGSYYWRDRDRAAARIEKPAFATVRAVNIDTMTEYDIQERRSPGSWAPRVEVEFTVQFGEGHHILTGDLSARAARDLAMDLLLAADLIDR